MKELKTYLFEKKNSDPHYHKVLFYAMESELKGYDTSWYKDKDGSWKDYKNGILKIDNKRYDELIWMNENNITVLHKPWVKLRFYIASLLRDNDVYTQEEGNVVLSDLVEQIRTLFPDFKGFEFPKVTELNYRQYYVNIENTDDPSLIKYGHICSYTFIKNIEKYVSSIIDLIFNDNYTIILDNMEEGYIDRMISDNLINVTDYKIIRFNDDDMSTTVVNE